MNKSSAVADSSIHIYRDGRWLGPYTSEEKDRYFAEGKLLRTDFYWHKGMVFRSPLAVSYYVTSHGQWTGPHSREELDLYLSEGRLKKTDWYFSNEPKTINSHEMPMRLEYLEGAPFRYKIYLALLVSLPVASFIFAGKDWLEGICFGLCVFVAVLTPVLYFLRKDRVDEEKVRNDMFGKHCPCGSGRNFKECCSINWEVTKMWEEMCPCGSGAGYKDCCYEPSPRISSSSDSSHSSGYHPNSGGFSVD